MSVSDADWPTCVESFDSPQYPQHKANPANSYLVIEPNGHMVWLCDSDCLRRHYDIEWETTCQQIATANRRQRQ